jgi:hypothetical protein
MIAGALITLGASAGLGLVALMIRDSLRQEERAAAAAAAALEPDPALADPGAPGTLLAELSRPRQAGTKPQAQAAPPGAMATPELLAGQSETKRNQMLVVDLYLQVAGRYPTAKERSSWFDAEAPLWLKLRSLRLVGEEDVGVANFIAGTLMEAPAYRQRFPAPSETLMAQARTGDGAAAVGAMFARQVGALPEARGDEAALLRAMRIRFGLSVAAVTPEKSMANLLREASDSTDVGEHWLEPGAPVDLELDAIRTSLRNGRAVVARGHDPEPRWVLVAGFDAEGAFLVRDPRGAMGEKTAPEQLLGFLRGAAGPADAGVAVAGGVWLDVPARPLPAAAAGTAAGRPATLASFSQPRLIPSDHGLPGFTGLIEGAQANLTRLRIPPGHHTMRGTMSTTAEQIDAVLAAAHSPAAGSGKAFVQWGQYYNLDPVYALAFFKHESWFGTHPRWVGQMGDGKTTKNIGNIRYYAAPDPEREPQFSGFNGFRAYKTWEDGIQDWFKLLAFDSHYAGLHTVEAVLPIYAPSHENDTGLYIRDVNQFVEAWRGPPLDQLRKDAGEADP